jgi:hypothetical protein
MQDRKTETEKTKAASKPSDLGEIELKPAGDTVVTAKDLPAKAAGNKRIHPRRPLPLVPDAPDEETK